MNKNLATLFSTIFLGLTFLSCKSSTCEFPKGSEKLKFPKSKIELLGETIEVEMANTELAQARGLMCRTKKLKDNEGMVFTFSGEAERSFWMKNTFIPLTGLYFDGQKNLVSFAKMKPVKSEMEEPSIYPSNGAAKYVIELSENWYKKIENYRKKRKAQNAKHGLKSGSIEIKFRFLSK